MSTGNLPKIGLICSRGGHLFQLYQLKDWWQNYPHIWITDKGGDTDYLLSQEKVYYGYFPEQRNLINALRNTFLALKVIIKEKPQILVSTGAGIAPPFFLIGKIYGCRLIYIEPIDFIKFPTLTGQMIYHLSDLFIIQNKKQKKFFPLSCFWGKTI